MKDTEPFLIPMTAEELEHVSYPDKVTELVRGQLVVHEPPGARHGSISSRLTYFLGDFVYRHGLGRVFAQDTGFHIESNPDTVRAPDVAFLAQERDGAIHDRGYARIAPDLVAEVLSPDDRPGEVRAKVADWLAAGVRLVWVIDPQRRAADVYRADRSVSSGATRLDGEDVLPGFTCSVDDLLL
ncbi:MAG TPA: Uma2 family endonuclease [Gemmatimonadaceae bacterium]|jgi:Uma2 family endonuclease|nr:Uma2 family endonuclease [Gemmatimonadaceae bacterium]